MSKLYYVDTSIKKDVIPYLRECVTSLNSVIYGLVSGPDGYAKNEILKCKDSLIGVKNKITKDIEWLNRSSTKIRSQESSQYRIARTLSVNKVTAKKHNVNGSENF